MPDDTKHQVLDGGHRDGRAWQLGRYRLELVPWRRVGWRWACEADGIGVGGYRTPWGAWWSLRRWERGRGACL